MTSTTRTFSDLTPYRASQILTLKMRAAGLLGPDEKVIPNTMYNLKVPWRYGTPRKDGGDGVFFKGNEFNEFLQNVIEGKTSIGAGGGTKRQSLTSLMAEYDEVVDEVVEQDAEEEAELLEDPDVEAENEEAEEADES